MRRTQRQERSAGMAAVDVVTVIVLLAAVYLLVSPGSELRNAVSRWRIERATRRLVQSHWSDIVALAEPLYETEGMPEVVEFVDYECPYCRLVSATVDSAIAAGVRIGVIQLPLSIHRVARPAALAALCAAESGTFQNVHRALLHSSSWQEPVDATGSIATADLGVDAVVEECMATSRAADRLQAHVALAETLRVGATPLFVSERGALNARPTVSALSALARGHVVR